MTGHRPGVVIATVLGLALLLVAPTNAAEASAPDPIAEIRGAASGKVRVSVEQATGRLGFVRTAGEGDLFPDSHGRPVAKATAYLAQYGDVFGAPIDQLVQTSSRSDGMGTTVTFRQRYHGLPVFGSQLNVNFDTAGDLIAVNGFAAPDLNLSVTPALGRAKAAQFAVAAVRADPPKPGESEVPTTGLPAGLRAAERELVIYRQGSLRGVPGESLLAWRVLVTNEREIGEQVFIAANSGKVINRYSTMPGLIDRQLINVSSEVWNEGDPLPGSLNSEQQRILNATGDTYWFFENAFGRDSYDEGGAQLTSALNPPGLACPGANWNGSRTNFCTGVTADDVVAHEWAHAYTEGSSDLVYQFQSGALNEAYSDIWGETIDLINGRDDEEEGNLTATRPMGGCSTHSSAQPVLAISAPTDLARDCMAAAALFGPSLSATGTSGGIVAAIDVDEDGSVMNNANSIYDGCSTFTNPSTVAGKIALVDRAGGCTPVTKAANAQAAGAIALVVANNNETLQELTGDGSGITIPTLLIGRANGTAIRASLLASNAVSGTLKDSSGPRHDSYRWLVGEDVTTPGGASRDLWTPTCLGDPGKVSDAEYYCAGTDNGGVHHNSGIPAHAYALLVDGGTYNGVHVTGLGLNKAAAIHYRAQTAFLTPTADFTDHADALSLACTTLVGLPIQTLSTSPNAVPTSAPAITSLDCNSVTAVIAATQLRTKPTQCGILLDPNAPNPCGSGHSRLNLFSENFSDGLTGWTQLNEGRVTGGTGYPWLAITTDPAAPVGQHSGMVAHARNLNVGNCSGGVGDVTSRDALISPPILLETAALTNPRLTFDHYVATEDGVDGGNVKVKLNDGPWLAVPNTAYTFNGLIKELTETDNSNPLAGEDAFTGANGGLATGSWGQSQIDLTFLAATSGDTVQIMFDFGRDGCFGIADGGGWYVDNVTVSVCRVKVKLTTEVSTQPSFGTAARVRLIVARDGTTGSVPDGAITLRNGAGAALGTAIVSAGKASFSLPPSLAVGTHSLTAAYAGTSVFEARAGTVKVTVGKAHSQAIAKPSAKKLAFRANFTVTVKVSADVAATGVVKILKGTKLLGKATVKDGAATIKVKKNLKSGKHLLRSLYVGSDTVGPSEDSFKIRIR